jgi:hypothetical protein
VEIISAKALKLSLKVGAVPLLKSLKLRSQGLEPMAGIGPTQTCSRSFLGSIFAGVIDVFSSFVNSKPLLI